MKTTLLTASLRITAALLAFVTADAFGGDKYRPAIDPANFTHVISNPYFPLIPGTTFTVIEKEGRETRENKATVTHETKTVMGVKCVIVHDTVTIEGVLLEDTYDWYAQAKDGAVWYFGETTKEFKSGGRVSTAGSWEAGVKGAQPGIIMPSNPRPGAPYKQEFFAGEAEDVGQVVAVGEAITVPHGSFKDCVKIKEWSMLESGHAYKWFAKGVGFVRGESSAGEVATLISVTKK